jgi:HSP20 family protein
MWNLMSDFDGLFQDFAPRAFDRAGYDLEEMDSGYVMTVDLPGVRKEDLKLEIADQVLTLSGEKRRRGDGEGRKFSLRVSVPADVDAEKIEASLEDGILQLALPKLEAVQPRRISIGAGESSGLLSRLLGGKKAKPVNPEVA